MIAWICSARRAAAGKSLGTDLAKGKLTLPVMIAAGAGGRRGPGAGADLVEDGRRGISGAVGELLAKYDALRASLEIIHQYLEKARQILRGLPATQRPCGLLALTEYLARKSSGLGLCLRAVI